MTVPGYLTAKEVQSPLVGRQLGIAWRLVRHRRYQILGYLSLLSGGIVLGIVPPLVFRRLVDAAVADASSVPVLRLGVAAGAALFGAAVIDFVATLMGTAIATGLLADVRSAIFASVQRMPFGFFVNTPAGAVISRLNNEATSAQSLITGAVGSITTNALTVLATALAMLFLDWRATLAALLIAPLFLVPAKAVGRRSQQLTRAAMTEVGTLNQLATERLGAGGALLIRLFGRPEEESSAFLAAARRVQDANFRLVVPVAIFRLLMAALGAVGLLAVYLIGVRSVSTGTTTIGTIVALAAYVQHIYSPMVDLTNARVGLMNALVGLERVVEIIDAPILEPTVDDDQPPGPRGGLAVRNLSFQYPALEDVTVASLLQSGSGGQPAHDNLTLRDVSFDAKPGSLTAVVGATGAGKSTLAHLLVGLYQPTEGVIELDGAPMSLETASYLRSAVSLVSQDAYFFHDTVAANLRYARPNATAHEIEEACRAAQIHDTIAALPNGYETVVGERGHRFSGGERQRLALARMLLRDPAVVVLDEATAHLDTVTEAAVQAAIRRSVAGRTAIVIAHRLTTIVAADQILVLHQGELVERGTHDELLAKGGRYAELHAAHSLVDVTLPEDDR